MNPVWVLSVDLQAKTATFQSGMGDAARAARGSFGEIRGGAGEAGREVGYSMGEARHAVMLLTEEFGGHMPRAIAGFIASLGPLGAALEAAFPFLAIIVGATLLLEHLEKMHEAEEKLTDDQAKFGLAVQNAWNSLDTKILEAQKRADELRNNHFAALSKELELIDRASMQDLVKSFEDLQKSADVVLDDLKVKWYQFGIGSEGAKHALTEFRNEYEALANDGKAGEAARKGLLSGTLAQAERILELQKIAKDNDGGIFTAPKEGADIGAAISAEAELSRLTEGKLGFTEKEIKAQEQIVRALQEQQKHEQQIAEAAKTNKEDAKLTNAKEASARQAAAAKESAESMARLGAQAIAADRATADAQLTIQRATIEQRLASDIDFADRERDMQLATNQAEIAALDKFSKDYQNQLKALNDKTLEIQSAHDAAVTSLRAKASVESNALTLANLETGIRQEIEATQQGTAARVAAIDEGIRREQELHLEDSNFYKGLLVQRTQAVRQQAEEESRLNEALAKEEADNELKNGELILAAQRQSIALAESTRRQSIARQMSDEIQASNLEFALRQAALQKEMAALDQSSKDYQAKLKQLQDRETQLVQQHENDITNIKVRAEIERNQRVLAAEDQFESMIARGLTQSIMGHQTWGQMVLSIGDQVVSGMLENAIKSILALDMTKEKEAASAARQAFLAGMHFPFPANLVMAPVLAAGAFAAVMAFQEGGAVPGVGRGDIVPAMLEPGEEVVTKKVVEMAKNGGGNNGPKNHILMHNTFHVNTIDGDGMQKALETHTDQLERHFTKVVRRMNR